MSTAVFLWSILLVAVILGAAGTLRGWRAAQTIATACSFVFCIAAAASIGALMLPLPLIHLWLAIRNIPRRSSGASGPAPSTSPPSWS